MPNHHCTVYGIDVVNTDGQHFTYATAKPEKHRSKQMITWVTGCRYQLQDLCLFQVGLGRLFDFLVLARWVLHPSVPHFHPWKLKPLSYAAVQSA
jgi:hypothetical protein